MLKFTQIDQKFPDKRSSEKRKKDFGEIYEDYSQKGAKEQSSRCSSCGVPFCMSGCPLSNPIPDFLYFAANDRLKEAYEVSSSTNNFGSITGRICPQDRLCQGSCVVEQSNHGAVTIGAVEKHITDNAFENGWISPIKVEKSLELNKSVGIVGAGPAGLAAAEQLRKKGYQIEIYDRYDRGGGLLIYGIPNFKLEKNIVQRQLKYIEDSKINIHLNTEIGKDISFKDLQKKHDAVLIATGVYKAKEMSLEGDSTQIIPALDFLTASNRKGLGDAVANFDNGLLNAKGKNIVVIGGGDTAMDCVRTAIRQEAKSVKCLYRRDKENMPGSRAEVNNAEEEGIEFIWQSLPKKIKKSDKDYKLDCVKMRLSEPDGNGRRVPQEISGSEFNLDADMVIAALGFSPENLPKLFNIEDLPVTKWGTIRVGFKTMMTNIDGVFAAGDIVRGASLVVWGIRDGREVAESIHSYIAAKDQSLSETSKAS